jgi:hypothetical protein
MHHNQDLPSAIGRDGHPPLLDLVVFVVKNCNSKGIGKDFGRLLEGHSVFPQILRSLARVPFKIVTQPRFSCLYGKASRKGIVKCIYTFLTTLVFSPISGYTSPHG